MDAPELPSLDIDEQPTLASHWLYASKRSVKEEEEEVLKRGSGLIFFFTVREEGPPAKAPNRVSMSEMVKTLKKKKKKKRRRRQAMVRSLVAMKDLQQQEQHSASLSGPPYLPLYNTQKGRRSRAATLF